MRSCCLSVACGWLVLTLAAFGQSDKMLHVGDAAVGFRLHLGQMKIAGIDISNEEMDTFEVRTEGTRTVGVWKGHPIFGADFAATAVLERQDTGWEYSFGWSGLDAQRFFVETVSFPDLVVPRTDKSGILYSRAHGMGMVRRPVWADWGWEREPCVKEPMREFQFVALLDDEKPCWYVDAHDSVARQKLAYAYCRANLKEPRARLGILSYVPMLKEKSMSYTLPWKGVIRPFRGGWWEAAQLYKPWAMEQPWTAKARRRTQTPQFKRLREICFWAWNRGAADQVVPPFERFMEESGVSCALDWYWWHHQSYDTGYPNFWPPRDGEAKFAATIAALRRRGAFTMVYTNGLSRDLDDETWNEGEGGEKDARVGHDGRIFSQLWNIHMPTPHRLAATCGEGRGFQKLLGGVIGRLADAGLDAVYLDQVSCGSGKPCWNPRHTHAPGDVVGDMNGYYRFIDELHAAHPSLTLASEEVSEAFLGEFDFFISLFGTSYERCGLGALPEFEAVPVWNALYHGLTATFGTYSLMDGIPPWDDEHWPASHKWTPEQEKDWAALFPDQFAVEFGRTVAWGNQPTAHAMRPEHPEKYPADYRFMIDCARFYRDHRDFLFDGELRSPGRLACAVKKVDFQRRGIYHPAGRYVTVTQPALPTVFHNVWKSAKGEVAAILVNWSTVPQRFALTTPDGRAEGEIAARSCRKVPLALE